MASLILDEDAVLVRDTAERFLSSTCSTDAVRRWASSPDGFDRSWWSLAAALGWLETGPAGGGSVALAALLSEILGRHVAPGPVTPTLLVVEALALHRERSGSEHPLQQDLVAGRRTAAWCADARAAGGVGRALTPVRGRRTDAGVVLTGHVPFVEAATSANPLLVLADIDGELRHAIVASDAPGISLVHLDAIDLVRRFASVTFKDVAIEPTQLLAGDASQVSGRLGDLFTLLACADTLGAAWRMHEVTVEYMTDRHSFGRPLASYQALKHRVADQLVTLHSCAAAISGAADAMDASSPDASELCSVAASFVHDRLIEVLQECVQLHGGIGVTWEHDLHLYLRRAATNRCRWGSPEAHRDRLATLLDLDGQPRTES